MQTKSNFWAGATIWANVVIVILLYFLLLVGVRYFLQHDALALWGLVNPLLVELAVVLAVWLGVRSILKVTPINPENIPKVSIFPATFQVLPQVVVACLAAFYGYPLETWAVVSYFLLPDVAMFALTFYFLRRAVGGGKSTKMLVIAGVAVVISLAASYVNYNRANGGVYSPIVAVPPAAPTQAPTQAWLTYENDEYKISFDYPPGFSVDVVTPASDRAELSLNVHTSQKPPADALGQDIRIEYAGYYLDIYSAEAGRQVAKRMDGDPGKSCLFPIEPVTDFSPGNSNCKESIETLMGNGMVYVLGGEASPVGAFYEGYLNIKNLVVGFNTYAGYDTNLKHILNSLKAW